MENFRWQKQKVEIPPSDNLLDRHNYVAAQGLILIINIVRKYTKIIFSLKSIIMCILTIIKNKDEPKNHQPDSFAVLHHGDCLASRFGNQLCCDWWLSRKRQYECGWMRIDRSCSHVLSWECPSDFQIKRSHQHELGKNQ